jgi:hypothetical protein
MMKLPFALRQNSCLLVALLFPSDPPSCLSPLSCLFPPTLYLSITALPVSIAAAAVCLLVALVLSYH